MEMTAAIQYILMAAQSLKENDDTWACWCVLLWKTSRHRQHGLPYVPKNILTWRLREAKGGLKATLGNRVTARLSLYLHSFFALFCFFQRESCFPWKAMLKSMPANIGHRGPKPR